jgi:anti-sigma regulatory factor (Ser/Thr protein kinase)
VPSETRTELHLPGEAIAPALARAGVRSTVPDIPDQAIADLELLVTEVVTNAVRHSGQCPTDEIVVRVSASDRVRVEVLDRGPTFDRPAAPDRFDPSPSGWGLFLLERLTRAWGIEAERTGKKVWFELDVASSSN